MKNQSSTGAFGAGNPVDGIWQAMEQARAGFEKRVGTRVGRGDVRDAVLALLAEQPMHGYQIIHEIEERSSGSWKPSPGSVYPTLQLLADEGLIAADESNGRKTYSLTDSGRAQVAASGTGTPWSESDQVDFGALPKAGVALAQAAAQVGRSGTPAQIRQAVSELEDVRRRLYAILAQD
ncbi:PadR family transcriptional regulator [Rathayibacter sp. PhB127]|uniref:PadR family transcriptional regulator n=1 Tax=Rathayibacter sp. PhB127 TaxID=2485176 RepID=UPI000F4B4B52|nr:PadR family transcriptional regulator [Rathayibacter sp. PhB127]ROS21667.1 PadR family transcriptional regulator [Rathayibacter sp. PhB127]